jgi:predicted metal-dependent hydrolase
MKTDLADEIIYSRRKTLAISVLRGGKVVVRAPLRTSRAQIATFLQEKAAWIEQARAKMLRVQPAAEPYRYREGELIWFLGQQYPLHLTDGIKDGIVFKPGKGFWLAKEQQAQAGELLEAFYRRELRGRVLRLVEAYAKRDGFAPTAVHITRARTRWGSCSGKGSLNFSYRLALTPPACIEYVVVHELVHTRIPNHSSQFWAEVARILPSYRQPREWLKKHGSSLPLLS